MKMEKLELKHLAPYLPYGLKGKIMNGKYAYASNTGVVKALQYKGIFTDHIIRVEEWCPNEKEIINEDVNIHRDRFKPILRPLSDLTKEIEVNCENFVPLHKLMDLFEGFFLDFEDILKDPLDESYCIVVKLFEWRFDIFNLIEKGLAIDINTLQS